MANECHSHDCGGHTQSSVHQTLDEMEFERGIWSAAMNGETNSVERFLKKGVDANSEDSYGYTALHYASRNGHEDVCKMLLAHRANSNSMTRAGKVTPVHRAANRGHLQLLKLLLKHRGDPGILDSDGKNALHKVVGLEFPDALVISELGGKSEASRSRFVVALVHVVCRVLDFLFSIMFYVASDVKASETGQSDVITFLLENYPNLVNCRDNQGKSPKDYVSEKHPSCLSIFETKDHNYRT